MEVQKRVSGYGLVAGLLLLPGMLSAQIARYGATVARQLSQPGNSFVLDRQVLLATKRPDIRLSVARLDHAVLLSLPADLRPHSSAFLFQTQYQGHTQVWAATAGHTAQQGEAVRLTFYDGKKEIPIDGELVQPGPALLSDAALIKITTPLSARLRPFVLAKENIPHGPLTTWGYSHSKLYRVAGLSFEKDNTRFIRTDFPRKQKKRNGLCGGPLLNAQGQVVGIHCGSTLDDKAFASSMRIIPYLLKAYYEGTASIPLQIGEWNLGEIDIHERITQIICLGAYREVLNILEVYDQLHQSDVLRLLADPEIRYLKLALGSYDESQQTRWRYLVFDKQTKTHTFEPFQTVQTNF